MLFPLLLSSLFVISFEEFVMQSMGRSSWFALSVSQFKQSPSAYGSHIKSIPCIQPLLQHLSGQAGASCALQAPRFSQPLTWRL